MNDTTPSSVLVIDDHPIFRRGLVQLINSDPDFRLVGQAASGREGLELADALAPGLTLLDLNMKEMDGLEVLRHIKAARPESVVVMLTVSDADDNVVAAMRGGANGYLLKDSEPEEILDKLRRAAAGGVVLSESLTGALTRALRDEMAPAPATADTPLTDREREILGLIAEGLSNKLIGLKLGISDGTVKVHVKNLLRKLNLRSRLEAAVWAIGHEKKAPAAAMRGEVER